MRITFVYLRFLKNSDLKNSNRISVLVANKLNSYLVEVSCILKDISHNLK